MGLIRLFIVNGHLYLSGVWLSVDVRVDTKKDKCLIEIKLCAQNLLPTLGSMIKMIQGTYMNIY